MSDLIKREDAIEMVHAFFGAEINKALPSTKEEYELKPDELKKVDELLGYNKSICIRLKAILPEDAVPVVRCKDCKWNCFSGCSIVYNNELDKPKDDCFCSFGERGS